jgi:hypothetical protein
MQHTQQQDGRLPDQCARDRDPLLLPAAERYSLREGVESLLLRMALALTCIVRSYGCMAA